MFCPETVEKTNINLTQLIKAHTTLSDALAQAKSLNFCSKNSRDKLWAYDLKTNKSYGANITDLAVINDFQTLTHIEGIDPYLWEKKFGELEDDALCVIRQIISSRELPSSMEEMSNVICLIALFAGRNRYTIQQFADFEKQKNLHILDKIVSNEDSYNSFIANLEKQGVIEKAVPYVEAKNFINQRKFKLESSQPALDKSMRIEKIMTMTTDLADNLLSKHWMLIETISSTFVTSDKPVTFIRINKEEFFITFPLSPNFVLIGANITSVKYPSKTDVPTELINYGTTYGGADYVYSSEKIILPERHNLNYLRTGYNFFDNLDHL